MGKKNAARRSASSELRSSSPQANTEGAAPWWMPDDLDIKTKELAKDIMKDAYANGYFDVKGLEVVSLNKKRKFAENAIFAVITSEAWRKEFSKWCLLKPFEAAKLMVAMMPKNIKVEGDIKHQHAIVVPSTTTAEEWNQAHEARKELGDGDWGTDLKDTPFAKVIDVEAQ
jgi:hypothetical protein